MGSLVGCNKEDLDQIVVQDEIWEPPIFGRYLVYQGQRLEADDVLEQEHEFIGVRDLGLVVLDDGCIAGAPVAIPIVIPIDRNYI